MENPFEEIIKRLDRIEANQIEIMKKFDSTAEKKSTHGIMTVSGLIKYLEEKTGKKYSKATIYVWTYKKAIHFRKVNNKSLVFDKEMIDQWLLDGKTLFDKDQKFAFDEVMLKANTRRIKRMSKAS